MWKFSLVVWSMWSLEKMLLRLTDRQKFASKLNWQVLENLKSSLLTVEAVLSNTIFFEHPELLQPHKEFDCVVCPGSLIMRKKRCWVLFHTSKQIRIANVWVCLIHCEAFCSADFAPKILTKYILWFFI
jgi:hypothetical protein